MQIIKDLYDAGIISLLILIINTLTFVVMLRNWIKSNREQKSNGGGKRDAKSNRNKGKS